MSVSVIIPNLNSSVIGLTLNALIQQDDTSEEVEIIVVGMDQPNQVFAHPRIRFDRSDQPIPPAKARNRGAAQSHGDLLVFLDSDCIPRPGWLHKLTAQFTDPSFAVVGGGVEFSTGNYWNLADNLGMFYENLSWLPPGERRILPSLNLAVRKSVFNEIGGFDEQYPRPSGEDADLSFRLRARGYTLHFAPQAAVIHAPPRNRLRDLLRHGYYQGMYSTKVDRRYVNDGGLPKIFRSRSGLWIGSPILALLATLRLFFRRGIFSRYWFTAPAVFMAKLAWCFGAANSPFRSNHGSLSNKDAKTIIP